MTKNEISPKGKTAVFYPDGGARPTNPGWAGTGVHGYVYTEPSKKPEIISNRFLEYTNPREGINIVPKALVTERGYEVCDKNGIAYKASPSVKPDFFVDVVVSFAQAQTNNYAELMGFFYAFQLAKEVEGLEKVYILPDSQYALDCVSTYGDGWRRNGWKTKQDQPVKNAELIEDILRSRDELLTKGVKVEYIKVKGHSDNMGNCGADYLATIGVNRSIRNDVRVDVQWAIGRKYWDFEVERHPMLHGSRFIYNRKVELNTVGEVFMVEPADTDLKIGKRDHEGYMVVRLNEQCPSYGALLEAQSRYSQHENWPMNLKTDRLYNKFVQKYMSAFGSDCLTPNNRGNDLFFLDGGNVVIEHNPPALIYRTVNAFEILSERLDEYIEKIKQSHLLDFPEGHPVVPGTNVTGDFYITVGNHDLAGVDITEDFYDTVEKKVGKETILKKEIKKEIVVGYHKHFIDLALIADGTEFKRKVPITLGMDLPTRDSLKKLESEDPRITLVVWRTAPTSFQYACIVESVSGIGIWSNYFCSRFFT